MSARWTPISAFATTHGRTSCGRAAVSRARTPAREAVWLGLALYAAAFVFGAAFQSRAAIGAERAAGAGDDAEALRRLRAWSWGSRVIAVLLLVATWDMVFKPGL